jgi:nucleoside-diphosphate-sugar epimerase
MRAFVTGATGFVGLGLCLQLRERGDDVRALVRDPRRAEVLARAGVELCEGDLDAAPDVLARGMDRCDVVFHLAALAAPAGDPRDFERINVDGTRRVLDAAAGADVARVVHTSTAAVLGPSSGAPLDEEEVRTAPFFGDYERTKAAAEDVVRERAATDLDVVIVNPTRIYGPTLLRPPPAFNRVVSAYLRGLWRVLPADGSALGNYVTVQDVIRGHLLAAERGRRGERYLLGGENASWRALFAAIERAAGRERWLVPVPASVLRAIAVAAAAGARIIGRSTPISEVWVDRFLADWAFSTAKAERELGYRPTPLATGLEHTVGWLREQWRTQ